MSGSRGWAQPPLGPWPKRASPPWASRWEPTRPKERQDEPPTPGRHRLGIASAHTVRVLNGEGTTIAKRKTRPNVESLTAVETAALAGTPAGTILEVVMEPTGPAWLPIAVFFSSR